MGLLTMAVWHGGMSLKIRNVVDTVVKDDGERHRGLAELYK